MVGLPFCHRPPCLRRDSWNVNKQEPTIEENIRRGNTRIGESPRHDATDDEDYAFGRWSIKFDGSHERARSAFGAGLSSWTIDRNASATDSVSLSSLFKGETRRGHRFPRFRMNALHDERGHVRNLVGQSRSAIPEGRDPGLGLAGAPFNVFGYRRMRGSAAIARARAHVDYIIFSSRINFLRKSRRCSRFYLSSTLVKYFRRRYREMCTLFVSSLYKTIVISFYEADW